MFTAERMQRAAFQQRMCLKNFVVINIISRMQLIDAWAIHTARFATNEEKIPMFDFYGEVMSHFISRPLQHMTTTENHMSSV
jgi:hypothetical protein